VLLRVGFESQHPSTGGQARHEQGVVPLACPNVERAGPPRAERAEPRRQLELEDAEVHPRLAAEIDLHTQPAGGAEPDRPQADRPR
jgi:hypothetical protein